VTGTQHAGHPSPTGTPVVDQVSHPDAELGLTVSGQRQRGLMETGAASGEPAPALQIMPSLFSGYTIRPCLLGSDARGSCGHYIPYRTPRVSVLPAANTARGGYFARQRRQFIRRAHELCKQTS